MVTTLSLKIPDALKRRVDAAAAKRGTARSAWVREAMEAYLRQDGQAEPGSCLDLAGDLIGSVEGPPDLSTNKEYMEGFGQ